MKRAMKISGSVCCILTLLCTGAMIIGRLLTPSQFLIQIDSCRGRPCYLGIVPGETTWERTQAIIQDTPDLGFDFSQRTVYKLPGFAGVMRILLSSDDTVIELDLRVYDAQVNIGGIVAQLGQPCAIVVESSDEVALKYPGVAVFASLEKSGSAWMLKPTSHITQINLFDNIRSCDSSLNNERWRGFGTIGRP